MNIITEGRSGLLRRIGLAAVALAAGQVAWAQTPPTASPSTPATQAPATSTPPEPAQSQPDPGQVAFERMDRDGDGKVSSNEHAADARQRFDDMDADNNYHVSAEERDTATRSSGTSIADQIQGGKPADPADTNGNGELSTDESESYAEEEFRARDVNRDGSLDADEMKQSSQKP